MIAACIEGIKFLRPSHRKSFLCGLLAAAFLVLPLHAQAASVGWYYESFSWDAFQTYFGRGTTQQKQEFQLHMQELAAREQKDAFYNIKLTQRNLQL